MATRLVVMKDGFIQQIGAPKDVYDNPENMFVGSFIGSPSMNFFTGILEGNQFNVGGHSFTVPEPKLAPLKAQGYEGKEVIAGVRPEDIHDELLVLESFPDAKLTVQIEVAELMGAESILYSNIDGQEFVARVDARSNAAAGDQLEIAFDMNKVHFFDKDNEERIR